MGVSDIGILLALWSAPAPAADNPASALRPQTPRLQHAVARSLRESATFRDLVARLGAQGVVVWIVAATRDRGAQEACLQHRVTIAGPYRFLFVSVRDDAPSTRLVGLIAHELQHALEAADARVTTAAGFESLFRRIGMPCEQQRVSQCYETTAATAVQAQVLSELDAAAAAAR